MAARPGCPLDRIVQILAGPWTAHLLRLLQRERALHFAALRRGTPGISAKVLTQRLRRLEREGLLERRVLGKPRQLVCYRLTARGRSLRRVLDALDRVAVSWRDEAARAAASSFSSPTPRSIARGRSATSCGRRAISRA